VLLPYLRLFSSIAQRKLAFVAHPHSLLSRSA
jgi:hypothetical protein